MKTSVIMCVIALLARTGFADGQCMEGALFATSNYWGYSVSRHRQEVFAAMSDVETSGHREIAVSWYATLPEYPDIWDGEGSVQWMREKAYLIHHFSRFPGIRDSTNCWYAASGLLCRYRRIVREYEGGINDPTHSFTNMNLNPRMAEECLVRYGEQRMTLHSLRQVTPLLYETVTNIFPRYVLQTFTGDERMGVLSNALSRAGL